MFGLKFGRKARGACQPVAVFRKPMSPKWVTTAECVDLVNRKVKKLGEFDWLAEAHLWSQHEEFHAPASLAPWGALGIRNGIWTVDQDLMLKESGDELEHLPQETDPESVIHIGERGGRYYKRTRPDGTTYREYTW